MNRVALALGHLVAQPTIIYAQLCSATLKFASLIVACGVAVVAAAVLPLSEVVHVQRS
jgi:hypothetical protein